MSRNKSAGALTIPAEEVVSVPTNSAGSKESGRALSVGERSLQLSAQLQGVEVTVGDAFGDLLATSAKSMWQ